MTLLRPAMRVIYALLGRPPTQGRGSAMAQAFRRWPLAAETWVRCQVSLQSISGS